MQHSLGRRRYFHGFSIFDFINIPNQHTEELCVADWHDILGAKSSS
jgi:hypothetical protein